MVAHRFAYLRRIFWCVVACGLAPGGVPIAGAQESGEISRVPHRVALPGGKAFRLDLPAEYEVSIAAAGLKRVRFLAAGPDGRFFVTDMSSLADNRHGAIYVLDGFNARSGTFAKVIPYLLNLRNPNSLAFYKDAAGQDWLYLNYKYGGWHLTRTILFGEKLNRDKLYISVGSSCNACEEKEEIRATVSVMDADGKNPRIIASGLRNAVGLKIADGKLYATNMGADHLGNDAPDDTMFVLDDQAAPTRETKNYGWPYCYFANGQVQQDPKFESSVKKADCRKVPPVFTAFAAHGSPLGLAYFDAKATDPLLRDHFLVALHGSGHKNLKRGYKVVRVGRDGKQEDFITGFLQNGTIYGRPCDIFRIAPDTFLLTDDHRGVIYSIRRK